MEMCHLDKIFNKVVCSVGTFYLFNDMTPQTVLNQHRFV